MTSITTIFAVCLVLVILLILRAVLVLKKIRQGGPSKSQRSSPIRTVVVLGSGGHTTEMLQLLQSLDPKHYNPLTFIVAQTDTTSMKRVQARNDDDGQVVQPDAIHFIPRSREVGQSYLTSILTTVWSLIYTLGIMVQVRPGLLLCNGPGTCLPIAVWTFVGRVLGLWEGKIVFCESFCRVTR